MEEKMQSFQVGVDIGGTAVARYIPHAPLI